MADEHHSRLVKLGIERQSELEALGFDANRSRRQLPPLQTLVAFEAAARLESFTLAARELNLTQPAISQQVRLLEERLGFDLFERSNNRIALTRQGEQLARVVTSILDDLTESVILARSETARATLSVSLLPSFASTWFAARVGRFEAASPNVDLFVFSTVACTEFGQEDADVAIRWGVGGWDEYYEEKILDERFILVAAPSLLNDLGAISTIDDLKGVPFVRDPGQREWRTFMEQNDADPSDHVGGLFFGDQSAAVTAILSGHVVGVVRDVLVDHLIARGLLVELPFQPAPAPRGYHFICPRAKLHRPEVQGLLGWLREEARAMRAGNPPTPA